MQMMVYALWRTRMWRSWDSVVTSGGSSEEEGEDHPIHCKTFKKSSFLGKSILNIITSPNNWLKHTIVQWRSAVASTALGRVASWCSRRTAIFRPPLGTLTSTQNLGGSWFSPPSIDLHVNYDRFQRTSSKLSELLQHESTSCPPNQRIRDHKLKHKQQLASTAVHKLWWLVESKKERQFNFFKNEEAAES